MDSQVNYIRQRLSLRKPLAKALELTARITDKLSLKKPMTDSNMLEMFIAAETAKILQKNENRRKIVNER